jgi:hypothetical protein
MQPFPSWASSIQAQCFSFFLVSPVFFGPTNGPWAMASWPLPRARRTKSGNPFSPHARTFPIPRRHRPSPPATRFRQQTNSTPNTRPRHPPVLHDFQVAGCGGGGARGLRGRASTSAPAAPTCQLPVHSLFLLLLGSAGNCSPPSTKSAAVSTRGVIMAAQGSLIAWRAVFAALGVLMVGTLVYTCATDGSPFRPELLTP